jgi:hypothetical protein
VGGLLAWLGLASDRFTALWEGYRASARQAAGALNETVQTLQNLATQIENQAEIIEIARAIQLALQVAAGIEVGIALVQGGLDLLADAAATDAIAEETAAGEAVTLAEEGLPVIDQSGEVEIDAIQTGPGATDYPSDVSVSVIDQSVVEKEFGQTSGTWGDGNVTYKGNISGNAFQNEVSVTDGPGGLGINKELDLGSLKIKGRIGDDRLGLWGSLKPKLFSLGSSPGDLSFSPLKLQARAGVDVAGYSVGVHVDLGPSVVLGLPSKPGQKPDIKTPFLKAGFILGLA